MKNIDKKTENKNMITVIFDDILSDIEKNFYKELEEMYLEFQKETEQKNDENT